MTRPIGGEESPWENKISHIVFQIVEPGYPGHACDQSIQFPQGECVTVFEVLQIAAKGGA